MVLREVGANPGSSSSKAIVGHVSKQFLSQEKAKAPGEWSGEESHFMLSGWKGIPEVTTSFQLRPKSQTEVVSLGNQLE